MLTVEIDLTPVPLWCWWAAGCVLVWGVGLVVVRWMARDEVRAKGALSPEARWSLAMMWLASPLMLVVAVGVGLAWLIQCVVLWGLPKK